VNAPVAQRITSDGALIPDMATLLDALATRREELNVSNQYLEEVGGFTTGQIDKWLGPARAKTPSLPSLFVLMDLLGASFPALVEDPAKMARMSDRWERRRMDHVRPTGVGRLTIRRARPHVLRELAKRAGKARWAGLSPEQRREAMKAVRAAKVGRKRIELR
jgi:hypothetical protein